MRMRDLRFFWLTLIGSLSLIVLQVAFPTWRILPLIYGEQNVPLHYNIHIGVDTVGLWWQIYTVPALGLGFLLVNGAITKFIFKREPMLAYVIASSTLFLEVLLFVAMIFIVLLNISYG